MPEAKMLSGGKGVPVPSTRLLLLAIPPAAGALACYLDSQTLLLVLYFLVSLTGFVAVWGWKSQRRSDRFFIVLLWSISLSLLISSALIGNNLHGQDIQDEYRVSSEVIALHRWDFNQNALYNSVISISLLVPILSIVSALDALIVHQLFLPLVYSIAPLILYKVYRLIMGPRGAFLSSLLFMSYPLFYFGMVALGRQEVAEVILILLLLMLLSKRGVDIEARSATIILLIVGFVTAHYSLVFVFLSILLFSTVLSLISKRFAPLANPRLVLVLLVITFGWYGFAAGGAAVFTFSSVIAKVTSGLYSDFFTPSSRPTDVLLATSYAPGASGIMHDLNRFTQYFVQLLLVLGFVALARKSKKTLVQSEVLPLMAGAFIFLGAAVIVPFLAGELQFNRVYHIVLLFISPCLVFGMDQLASASHRVRSFLHRSREVELTRNSRQRVSMKYLALAVILMAYFLFTSGWVWAITRDQPTSLILDVGRMRDSTNSNIVVQYYNDFIPDSDVAAARWLTHYRSADLMVCSDDSVRYGVLTSYGALPRNGNGSVRTLPGECNYHAFASYIYFSGFNNERLIAYSNRAGPSGGSEFQVSEIWPKVIVKNRVFSDGAAIYN